MSNIYKSIAKLPCLRFSTSQTRFEPKNIKPIWLGRPMDLQKPHFWVLRHPFWSNLVHLCGLKFDKIPSWNPPWFGDWTLTHSHLNSRNSPGLPTFLFNETHPNKFDQSKNHQKTGFVWQHPKFLWFITFLSEKKPWISEAPSHLFSTISFPCPRPLAVAKKGRPAARNPVFSMVFQQPKTWDWTSKPPWFMANNGDGTWFKYQTRWLRPIAIWISVNMVPRNWENDDKPMGLVSTRFQTNPNCIQNIIHHSDRAIEDFPMTLMGQRKSRMRPRLKRINHGGASKPCTMFLVTAPPG